jgi:predicted Ser/Thr protein kinase
MTLVGRTVGHVRVEALLGVGGMGEVYRGFDEVLERAVALKVIRPEHRLTPETKERFLREARVLSRLDHPNICRVHELIEDPAGEILVLEYIDGPTLKQAVARGIPEGEKLRVAEQVAAALAAAHAREVVHRDLKPDNVMLTAAGEVKVLDFGLARVQGGPPAEAEATRPLAPASADASSHGSLVGTLQYMSPEQARGEPAGPASDLYSLGLLLQELFTGAPAYEPTSGMVAMLARVAAAQTRPATGLDPHLARLVEALKSGPPAARPSAAAVVAALAAVRAKPERRRRRRLHAALASTAALLVLALVWIARLSRSAPFALGAGEAHTLAVLPFSLAPGADPRLEELAPGLAAVLAESLEQLPRVRALDPRRVAEALAAWGGAGPETVRRLETSLGVDVAVAVRLVPGAEGLVCDTELRSGERPARRLRRGAGAGADRRLDRRDAGRAP